MKIKDYWIDELKDIREFEILAEIEDKEILNLRSKMKNLIDDQFIETATVDGITRFEKMLGLIPNSNDTLEDRRFRILTRWNNEIPYTWKTLMQKLYAVCGEGNFEIELIYTKHLIKLTTRLKMLVERQELREMLETIIPCNMLVDYYNELLNKYNVVLYRGMGVLEKKKYTVTSTF